MHVAAAKAGAESRGERDEQAGQRGDLRGPGHDRPRATILGVPVDCVGPEEAVSRCAELVSSGRGGHVVTLNPEMVLACQRDPELMQAVRGADLVVPDGIGVVLGLRLLGWNAPGRVPGIELATELMKTCAAAGRGVFMVGARPGVADEAARRMAQSIPELRIAGVHHGYFGHHEEGQVLQAIGDSRPGCVLVGLGAGRQEKWIARVRANAAPGAVWVGVGGSFDVMAGALRRAPEAWRRLGLEWLYRLLQEPRRLGRMASLPVFAMRVALEAIRGGGRRHTKLT